jgi:hypothetical protein
MGLSSSSGAEVANSCHDKENGWGAPRLGEAGQQSAGGPSAKSQIMSARATTNQIKKRTSGEVERLGIRPIKELQVNAQE